MSKEFFRSVGRGPIGGASKESGMPKVATRLVPSARSRDGSRSRTIPLAEKAAKVQAYSPLPGEP